MYEIAEIILKNALAYAKNIEVYIEEQKKIQVEIQEDTIDIAKDQHLTGVGLRMIKDNRMGFAHTSDMGKIKETIKMALSNLKANEADENFKLSNPAPYPTVKKIYDKRFHDLEVSDAYEFAKTMLEVTLREGCEPTSGGFTATYLKILILNSNGVEVEYKTTGFSGQISVNAEKNNLKSTAYEFDASCLMDLEADRISERACRIAKDSIGGEKIQTGDMGVVLDYHAVEGILGTFTPSINADNVQRGRSYLADKLGKEVANTNFSIYDDGIIPGGLNSTPADDEGTPSQRTTIIKEGILQGFIHDIYTASKGGVKSTGNGIRSSFSEVPEVSTTNIIFDFGDKISLDDIKNGILVTDVLGAHTANPISGDFSVEANNAFMIKNGEITKPVKKAMISGNIFNLLKKVQMVDSRIRQIGPFITPKIFVDKLKIIGD